MYLIQLFMGYPFTNLLLMLEILNVLEVFCNLTSKQEHNSEILETQYL